MANLILFFLVTLALIINTMARDCNNITNCDDCFRCGGTWCYDKPVPECKVGTEDNICSANRENLTNTLQRPGATMVNVLVKYKETFELNGSCNLTITSTFHTNRFDYEEDDTELDGSSCDVKINVKPTNQFCADDGTVSEQVDLIVSNERGSKVLKYQVPCACECSRNVKVKASECNYRGDYVCGVCKNCDKGWEGNKCEKKNCPPKKERGDTPQSQCTKDEDCNGNGVCECEQCICFKHLEGYFDANCRDVCTVTRDMDRCFININEEERCQDIVYEKVNETEVEKRHLDGSRIWIKCNISVDGCTVQYAAKRIDAYDAYDVYSVMILKDCESIVGAATGALRITVPAILGALAAVAALASVAGYMIWKNRSPPLPLSDPQYQNIDADFSQGENPLYKCPTSSFKNPTYGKC